MRLSLQDHLQVHPQEEALALFSRGGFPTEIAQQLGVSAAVVRSWLRKKGLKLSKSAGLRHAFRNGSRDPRTEGRKRSRYTLDETIFERPLTPDTAWVLGTVVGDGCVVRKKGTPVALDVVGDHDVCCRVAAILGSDAPVRFLRGTYNVRFFSSKLAASLARWGVGPAKTYTATFPPVPEELRCHVLRGYWEADGCVSGVPRIGGRLALKMTATSCSSALMTAVVGIVQDVTGTRATMGCYHPRDRAPRYTVSVSCAKAQLLGNWLWKESTSCNRGERKLGRFLQLGGLV